MATTAAKPGVGCRGWGPRLGGGRFAAAVTVGVGVLLAAAGTRAAAAGLAFQRLAEPREGAFTLLVPRGWRLSGGIFRVDASRAGGPLNALEAKCDLTVGDERGRAFFRILPDVIYAHPGVGAGLFPPGSTYQGAVVRPLESAPDYLRDLFGRLHPGATAVAVRRLVRLPGEVRALEEGLAVTNRLLGQVAGPAGTFRCDAAGAAVDYTEGGERYREVLLSGVVDMRAALTWKNTRTLVFRAPAGEFEGWRAAFDVIRASIRFDPRWVLAEAGGQRERAETVLRVLAEVNRIDREIAARSRVNRQEIMNDQFLVLTGQEEYVNPYTGRVEVDTDRYRYRWTTPGGDVYFTDREDEDPNVRLGRGDYRRTPVRRRRNE